jgi:hypothetical protein
LTPLDANRPNPQPTTQWQGELLLKSGVVINFHAPDRFLAQATVAAILAQFGSDPGFDVIDQQATFIYHESVGAGKVPCGWISEIDVPLPFAINRTTAQRMNDLAELAKAA